MIVFTDTRQRFRATPVSQVLSVECTHAASINRGFNKLAHCAKLPGVTERITLRKRRNENQARPSLRYSTGQTALLLFFVGLFAFVFPFLCWGALADPSHPHAHAHFVFVDPPLRHALTEIVFDPVHGHFHANNTCGDACDAAGQSQLDTLLVMLLLVLFFAWRVFHHLPAASIGMHTVLGETLHAALTPTPPPRPHGAASF